MNELNTEMNTGKRRKWVRSAAAIFISIILLLTFFSKTINNFLLPVVEVENAYSGTLENEITAQGEVSPLNTETINSYGAWKIKQLKVKEGDSVKKGDILAVIDSGDSELEIKKMELNIIKLKDDLKLYKNKANTSTIDSLKDDLETAKIAIDKAEKKLQEQKALYSYDAVTKESVEQAEEVLDTAKRDYESKQKALKQKEEELKKEGEDFQTNVSQKEHELEVGRLELENLKNNLPKNGVIKSPVTGTIKSVSIENGSTASSGQKLFEIIRNEAGYCVKWTLNSEAAGQINKKDSVTFKISEPESMELTSIVEGKKYSAESGAYEYSASLKDKKGQLEIGQKVDVLAKKSSKQYQMLVPNGSVIEEGGKKCIYLLKTKDGIMGEEQYVEKLEVNVIESDDFDSAIEGGGITSDDKIVVTSSKALSDKVQVKLR